MATTKISGTAIKFGSNIDTDVILPGKYLVLVDPKELAKHALEGLDPAFPVKAKKGVIIDEVQEVPGIVR